MRSHPSSFRPFQARGPRLAAAFAAFACLAPAAGAQTMQWFGEWVAPGAVQLYVSNTGIITNPGTLAQPLPTITSALAAAGGAIGTVPVTINVLSGTYGLAQGEAFPIALPAHGITIEAYTLSGAPLPIVNAAFANSSETFLFNALGTAALPDSVLRGLEIRNDATGVNSAQVRIAVPAGAGVQRVAPEIRFCNILGGAIFGVDIVGAAETNLEPVIEGNLIAPAPTKEGNPMVGVQVTGGEAPTSPLIRCNQIQSYPTNVLLTGGDLNNQPRLQSNFIQVGETNVSIVDCAPFVVGNTIAFAFNSGGPAVGIQWTGVTQMTLANNLMWNPDHGGMGSNPPDVVGSFLFNNPPFGSAWFNYDQDDILLLDPLLAGMPNFGPLSGIPDPDFVGGIGGSGAVPTDLHLNPTSFLRELGINLESMPWVGGFPAVSVPGAPAPIVVRRDHAFDFDFDARISLSNCDVGADEVTELSGPEATSGTRAATLRARVGSTTGSDIDALGNLAPTVGGLWSTEIEIVGTPGDLVLVLSGVGFNDFITDPSFPGVMIENTAVYQNVLGNFTLLPGMLTQSTVSVDLTGGSATVGIAAIPAGGVLVMPLSFGAFNPAFIEAEAHLQAIAFDPTLTLVQSTNRLSLDLNE